MSVSRNGLALSTIAGAISLILAQSAQAQSAESADKAGTNQNNASDSSAVSTAVPSGGSLDEIVVTATKRSESLQVVPITVDVVSQAALQSANLTDTADLRRLVPDLQFLHTSTPGNDAFGIRGVSTLASGYGLEQSVGVSFDGVPLARPVGSVADLVDIRRVEVLEGPQGMLFGKNSSAGLINIISNPAEIGKTETVARASFGSLNLRQYSATTNIEVTEDSALRLTAWKFSHDGPIHEVNTGQDMGDQNSDGGRLKYRWKPTENLDISFTGEWDSHRDNGAGYSIRSFTPNGVATGLAAYETGLGTSASPENHLARGLDLPYHDNGNTAAYTVQADYSIGEGTLSAIVSYRDIKNDNLFDPFPTDYALAGTQFRNEDDVHYDQLSEEIHYNSPAADRFRYTVGVFNYRLKLRDDFGLGFSPFPMATTDVNFDESLENDNYALFGESTFDVTSQLHFIAGLRGSHDQLRGSMDRTEAADANFMNGVGDTFGPLAAGTSIAHNDLSWRTGLQYQVTPDAMSYLTVSKGYKGPGLGYSVNSTVASLSANNGIVKPEIVHNYELGLKTQWFDRRLTANLSVYTEIFDNFQTSIVVPGTFITTTENAQQMRTSGVALNSSWFVTKNFSLAGNINYDHARFTNFQNASCYSATQTAAQGCVNGSQNLSGHMLANTPKTSVSLTARYQQPLGDKFMGFVQAVDTYHSAEIYSSLGDPGTEQGGFSLVNVSAGIDTADGRWGVSVYGNNVFDKHYVDLILASGGIQYLNDISYSDLQTFGIALTAKF